MPTREALTAHFDALFDDPDTVRHIDHPTWIANHPSGFGGISPASADAVFYPVNLDTLAHLTAHLSDAEVGEFVAALRDWWHYSNARFWTLIEPADLIALTFEQDAPEAARTLLAVAEHHGLALDEFFVR
jgi:hypothetical protein